MAPRGQAISSHFRRRRPSMPLVSSDPLDKPQRSSSQSSSSSIPRFVQPYHQLRGTRTQKSLDSNFSSLEVLQGVEPLGGYSPTSWTHMSPGTPTQTALKELTAEEPWSMQTPYRNVPGQGHHSKNNMSDTSVCSRSWERCIDAANGDLKKHCSRVLEQIQSIKFTAMCTSALLVCVLWVLQVDAKPSSTLLGDIGARNPAAFCILLSSLALSFAQIAEKRAQGWRQTPTNPSNQIHQFALVQRRRYYMQYGGIPLLLRTAHASAEIAACIMLGILLGKIGSLEIGWGSAAMKFILIFKAGSVVCPTIKFIRKTPETQSPFQSRLALVLEIIRSSLTSHHEKLDHFYHNWKFGMGFGSDLELCVPGLRELVLARNCELSTLSDVITCLCHYSKTHPSFLIPDIGWINSLDTTSSLRLDEDLTQDLLGLSDAVLCDILMSLFLQTVAEGVDNQPDVSRGLTSFRVELLCRLLHSSMDSPKTHAVAKLIFAPSTTPLTLLIPEDNISNSASDHLTDSLVQLLKVAGIALEKGVKLEDLMGFLEDIIPRLLSPKIRLNVRVGRAITAFTAIWASKEEADSEQFCRYRDKVKGLNSGEINLNGWLTEVERALDYKKIKKDHPSHETMNQDLMPLNHG